MPLEKQKIICLTKSTVLINLPTNISLRARASNVMVEHSYNCHALFFFDFVHFGVLARKIPLTCIHI